MEESHGRRRTYRGSTIAEAMSHSTMHTSVLAREELRIFEELISQFDSLSKAEMRAVGVTREWPAKDNQHALGVRGPQGDITCARHCCGSCRVTSGFVLSDHREVGQTTQYKG